MKRVKKIILPVTIMLTIAIISNVNAQERRLILDGYYGYGSLYNAVFKALVESNASNSNYSGVGPIGVKGEFLISKKVGFGIDIAYSSSMISYTETDFSTNEIYDASIQTAKLGIMPTFNYHFVVRDRFDSYFTFGLGYGNRTFSAKSDYAGYESPTYKSAFPVASRLGLGMRYYFTDNLGLNVGMGLGQGGLLNAGISARF